MFDLTNCTLCPRSCGIDRTKTAGVCGAGAELSVAKIMHHHWEEPCISGPPSENPMAPGSGTIFFTNCPLGCVYCQNGKISRRNSVGETHSPASLAREMLVPIFEGGKLVYNLPPLEEIRDHCAREIATMWKEVLRFENPHEYYVDLSLRLWDMKNSLIARFIKGNKTN